MRKNRIKKGQAELRQRLVREAARLMYEEGVNQFFDAKKMAAKRVLDQGQFRAHNLPSNREISEALAAMVRSCEGEQLVQQLFEMRLLALDVMTQLNEFSPRLIGSVASGRIRRHSDIDLHVFSDDIEPIEHGLMHLSWPFEKRLVTLKSGSRWLEYTHIDLLLAYPVELSIYPELEIRVRGRSSIDGKPIERVTADRLLQLIQREHWQDWSQYLQGDVDKQ